MGNHYLSWVLFTPLIGAALLLAIPASKKNLIRIWANIAALAAFAVSLPLVFHFDKNAGGFQFVERADWIPALGAHYAIGIDGISLLLVMLTTVIGSIAVLSSWRAIDTRVKEYYVMFLLQQTGIIGVFVAMDFFLFFVFWEAVLVPMYFIIGVWGGPRKLYAAIKFFLYTLAGGALMLLGILTLYFEHFRQFGFYTFEISELMKTDLTRPAAPGAVGVLGVLPRLRHQGADVPVPHLAAGRARGGAHGRVGGAGERAAEDGHLRLHPLLAAVAAKCLHRRHHRADAGRCSRSSASCTARWSA